MVEPRALGGGGAGGGGVVAALLVVEVDHLTYTRGDLIREELCVKSAVDEYWKEEKVEMMQQKIPENIHFNGSYVRKVMYEKWETLEPERGKKFEMLQQISAENNIHS